jgi:tetratricopeptide (TPR) repeat protein
LDCGQIVDGSTDGFRRARADAERAVALDPTLASGYLVLAAIQLSYDWNWDAADASLTKAESLEPGAVEVLRNRAKFLRTIGNLDEAIKCDQRAVVRDPLQPRSYGRLGYLLYIAGRYDEARISLQKALDLNPQVIDVHLDLGKIYIAEGMPQQALAEFEREPHDSEKLVGEGIAYYALDRKADANAALTMLIQTRSQIRLIRLLRCTPTGRNPPRLSNGKIEHINNAIQGCHYSIRSHCSAV